MIESNGSNIITNGGSTYLVTQTGYVSSEMCCNNPGVLTKIQKEMNDRWVLKYCLPEVNKNDIHISLIKCSPNISSARVLIEVDKGALRNNDFINRFNEQIHVNKDVYVIDDPSDIDVSFKGSVLTITFHKKEDYIPQNLEV